MPIHIHTAIFCLLEEVPVATRNQLEAALVFEMGYSANKVTKALRTLSYQGRIHKTSVAFEELSADIYSISPPCESETERIRNLLSIKRRVFDPNAIKRAGERYTRRLFIAANSYRNITQDMRLGEITVGPSGARADLCVTDSGGRRILVEIKNHREQFYPTHPLFGQLLSKTIEYDADLPALAAAHLSVAAEEYCRAWGIAVLHFERQLLSNYARRDVQNLRPILGPQPFEFVNPARPFQHGISHAAEKDLERVKDPSWIESAMQIWQPNRSLAVRWSGLLSERRVEALIAVQGSLGFDFSTYEPRYDAFAA